MCHSNTLGGNGQQNYKLNFLRLLVIGSLPVAHVCLGNKRMTLISQQTTIRTEVNTHTKPANSLYESLRQPSHITMKVAQQAIYSAIYSASYSSEIKLFV